MERESVASRETENKVIHFRTERGAERKDEWKGEVHGGAITLAREGKA